MRTIQYNRIIDVEKIELLDEANYIGWCVSDCATEASIGTAVAEKVFRISERVCRTSHQLRNALFVVMKVFVLVSFEWVADRGHVVICT